ncbi:discoidin domain-containing protein [Nonomuraea sp. NPDC048901]|uniref:discoidin domain-containing protein n=1 Tax=Nonomuraea sp. NPDC048901 TaxID=3155627 RepID=UPI0033D1DCF9
MKPSGTMLTAVLSLLCLTFLVVPAHAAAGLSVWTMDAADRPFTSSPVGSTQSIALYAARGEFEAAQILARSTSAQSGVSVSVSPLTGPGDRLVPTVRLEYNHPTIQQIGTTRQDPPGGGDDYYDALVENTAQSPAANTTLAWFYQVFVPAGQAPGVYTGNAVVQSASGNVTVPVSLRVYDVTVPPADQSTFKMNNWFTSAGWDYAGTIDAIPDQYDVKMFDEGWWTVIKNFAANHAKHRNNVIYADFQALLIPHSTVDAAGNFTFDWDDFDWFVKLFETAGALQYIYTPTLIEGGNQLEMLVPANGVSGRLKRVLVPYGDPKAGAYLDKVLPALKAHLDVKKWTDKFYMSAVDEPQDPTWANAANWLYGKYRQYFPTPRTNEAHNQLYPGTEPSLTTLTPATFLYQPNIAHYQSQRLAGKDLWLYTANIPESDYMNRFISHYLAETRLLPWLVWKIGGTGYLHWGWNYWWDLNRPGQHIDTFKDSQSGDGWLVRPNTKDNALNVYDSLRSEAQTDGLEDFELLNQLAKTKPVTAQAIANSLILDATHYERSGTEVEQRHKQILDELSANSPDLAFPYNDDFGTAGQHWRTSRGSWSVSGQEYVQASTAADWGVTSVLEGRAYRDVAAGVDLKITGVSPDGGSANWAGLMVRSLNGSDMDTGYLIAQRNNGKVFVYRNGIPLAEADAPGYTAGQWNRLRAVAKGNTLKVYSGTRQLPALTVNDAAFPVGNIALVTGGAAARFDNVHINPMTNAAEGATITASSSYEADGWGTGSAVDGRRSSATGALGWSSSDSKNVDHTEWVQADLGSARPVSRVDLYPRDDGANTGSGFPTDFTIDVSADGSTWTNVATVTGSAKPGAGARTFPFTPVSARYIKVTGTKLSTDQFGEYHMQFAEIEAAGGNLAAGRTVTSSSSVEYPAESWLRVNATDGVRHSNLWYSMGWSSLIGTTDHPEWLQVDLGGPTRVGKVTLYARNDGANTGDGFPSRFTIETSPDGSAWTTVTTQNGYPRPGADGQTFTFDPVTTRYVRVTGTGKVMQFAEIEASS